MRQIKVRLNVHWSLPDNALIYGSLNKTRIYRDHKKMVMYKPQMLYTMNYTRLNLSETAYTHCHFPNRTFSICSMPMALKAAVVDKGVFFFPEAA